MSLTNPPLRFPSHVPPISEGSIAEFNKASSATPTINFSKLEAVCLPKGTCAHPTMLQPM